MLKHCLKIIVTELAWRGWDLKPRFGVYTLENSYNIVPIVTLILANIIVGRKDHDMKEAEQ